MDYLQTLGQTLREIRVDAGLRREDCSGALSREYLANVERGRQSISIAKLVSLCECLGIPPSLVLTTVEARLAMMKLEQYQASLEPQVSEYLRAGRLRSEASNGGAQGVRGKRAENNRRAVQSLQSEGRTKTEIARELGIGTTTVDRHWRKADSSEST
ncbi:helix-turn-helix domain-containing protein [Pseudomonas cannabina]|uniref:Helix-turn-helix domain-containing protein n=1 Tax=Pseudomonas cannabina pv. alisalensis TaxID=757414 RepID=A0ABS1XIY9_PSEC1|nr:helix-turn-helix transcriptional regulator [Pseudomonas cannabina]MBM0141471.1 helix-turn-helix domain-containing protein [Pseudomonas cannabina pv. alisalensis]